MHTFTSAYGEGNPIELLDYEESPPVIQLEQFFDSSFPPISNETNQVLWSIPHDSGSETKENYHQQPLVYEKRFAQPDYLLQFSSENYQALGKRAMNGPQIPFLSSDPTFKTGHLFSSHTLHPTPPQTPNRLLASRFTTDYLQQQAANPHQTIIHETVSLVTQSMSLPNQSISETNTTQQVETSAPEYVCACGKRFLRLCGFKSHVRVHEARREILLQTEDGPQWVDENGRPLQLTLEECERNFGCVVCGKKFIRRHDLRRHFKIKHQDNKKFQCMNCNTLFSRSDALAKHIKTNRCSLNPKIKK